MREVARAGLTSVRSAAVTTATTPGSVAASATSIAVMRAWAGGLRAIATWSSPARRLRATRLAGPLSGRGSSSRWTAAPISFGRSSSTMGVDQLADRAHDVLVAGTAAQIARQAIADLVVGRARTLAQQVDHGHQHAGRAKPALQRVVLAECGLHRMQRLDRAQPLDGLDPLAVGLDGEHQARARAVTLDDHRAGAAHAVLAADMRARQTEVLAQKIRQQAARLDRALVGDAVDRHADRAVGHACAAAVRARRLITATRWRRKSAEAWRSARGSAASCAATAAAAITSGVTAWPTSTASAAGDRSTISPAPISARRAATQRPFAMVRVAAAAAIAKSP